MRGRQSRRNLPVTARTLETIIRIASANAKARLSKSVDSCDVDVAVDLMNFVIFHEAGGDADDGGEVGEAAVKGNSVSMLSGEEEEVDENEDWVEGTEVEKGSPRFERLVGVLQDVFASGETDTIEMKELLTLLNNQPAVTSGRRSTTKLMKKAYSTSETEAMLLQLPMDNKVICLIGVF